MAQSRRQRRKARRREAGAAPAQGPAGSAQPDAGDSTPRAGAGSPAPASRSERRNQAAREALEPLAPGERPLAVTIGAVVVTLLALANLAAFIAGVEFRGARPSPVYFAIYEIVMAVMAVGLWRGRYWAVLGLQALLGIAIVFTALAAIQASSALDLAIVTAIVIPSGVLFWFLVKAMARIQMPRRP